MECKWSVPIYERKSSSLTAKQIQCLETYLKNIISKYLQYHLIQYTTQYTTHPDSTAHGTIIIIKNNIWHHELDNFKSDFLPATVEVEDYSVIFSSIYCSLKHIIVRKHFEAFFETLSVRFTFVGHYNAKYQL